MDQFYYESGYIDASYYVYTAEAEGLLADYIDAGYIDLNYYQGRGAGAELVCELTEVIGEVVEANGTFSSEFLQSVTIDKIVSASSTLNFAFTHFVIADKFLNASASVSSEFAQTAQVGKILSAVIDCGALFSPGVIADAFKNYTAILDVVFTVNTVGAANRAASMTVDNIANLNAQAAKTADVNSQFTSTATQLAQVNKQVDTSSTLTSQSTLAVNALSVQFAAAALSSAATMSTVGRSRLERPLTVHSYSGAQINTTTKKFGAASLEVSNNSYLKYYADEYTIPQPYETNGPRQELVIEFWYRPGTRDGEPILQYTDGSTVFWQLTDNASFQYVNTSNATITKSASVAPTVDQFNHILIGMTANRNFSIFVNGTRRHNSTATTEFKDNTSGVGFLQIGQSTNGANGYVDELRVITGPSGTVSALGYDITQTTITQPSGQFANTTTTRFLGHYDVDFRDDAATLVSPSPALTSQFTLTASAQELSSGQAGLSSTSTVSALVGVNRSADSALSTAATLAATATRIQESASAQQAEFSQTASAVKTTTIEATLNQFATVVSAAARTRTAEITIASAFTPTLVADVFKNMTAILDAVATLSAQATTSVDSASALATAATLSSDLTRIRTVDSTITSSAQLAATVFRTQDNQAAITASATLSVVVGQEQAAEAAISSASTLTAAAVKTATGAASASLAFTQAASVERTRSTLVAVSSEFTQVALAVKINPGAAAFAATASLSALAVKTTEIVVSASTEFAQSTLVNRTVNPGLAFTSIATQLTVAFQNASGTVLLESTASLTALIGAIKQGVPERAITGIRFNDDAATELGDTFILLTHRNTPPAGPNLTDRYAVAFWAYSPQGTVLTHNPTTFNAASGYMAFDNGSFELRSPSPNNDYRSATWTGLATEGWHHYLIYQTPTVGAENPLVKLYQDGVLKSDPAIFSYDDGTSPSPPTDDLLAVWFDPRFLFSDLNWCVGAQVQHLERTSPAPGNEVAAYTIQPIQGVLSQFVSYWTSVPDFTDTATRQQLYNNGYVDLGNMGTSSGLARPNIYLRLQNYRDVKQLGSLSFDQAGAVRWLELTNLDFVPPSQSNVRYVLANDHEGSVQDNFGNGFLAIADLTCAVSGVFLFELPISAEFSTSILGQRVRTADAALICTSTLAAQAQVQASLAATLNAQATLGSVNVDRFRAGAATLASSASITVEQGFLRVAAALLTASATLACEPTEIEAIQGAAALTTTTTVAADVNNIIFMQATADAEFAVTAEATLIPPVRADASLTSAFSIVITAGGVYGGISLEASAGTLTVSISATRGAGSTIAATATQLVQPTKRTGIPLTNLSVQGFTLTAGDIINFEPSLTYVIPEETRLLMILGESREYIIEQETRLLTLLEG